MCSIRWRPSSSARLCRGRSPGIRLGGSSPRASAPSRCTLSNGLGGSGIIRFFVERAPVARARQVARGAAVPQRGRRSKLEYLTDGITESIINSLSQLTGVRVVPRSLVFRYKGLQADPATVGLALNARTILTGRVVQQGDVLNIQAELVDARPSRSCGASSSGNASATS